LITAHDVVQSVLMGQRRNSNRYTARGLTSHFQFPTPLPSASKLVLDTAPEENPCVEFNAFNGVGEEESSQSSEMQAGREVSWQDQHEVDIQRCPAADPVSPHSGLTIPESMV